MLPEMLQVVAIGWAVKLTAFWFVPLIVMAWFAGLKL